jgi:hypothetical protein
MRLTRLLAPAAASLALIIVLAACQPTASDPSIPTSPTPTATAPSESPAASPTPAESPSPAPGEVVEFELPMIAHSTADGVDVHARPSTDAPLLIGQQYPDLNRVEISLSADERVWVTLGPLVSERTSWYQVSGVDGGPTAFGGGWVSAEFLAREGDPPAGGPQIVTAHGQGSGGEISVEVSMGTPLTVEVAMAPMEDEDSCDIDVTLIRTDGLDVNLATQTVTEPDTFYLAASIDFGGVPSLFQDEAGTVTLEIETDCSWTASLTQPAADY